MAFVAKTQLKGPPFESYHWVSIIAIALHTWRKQTDMDIQMAAAFEATL